MRETYYSKGPRGGRSYRNSVKIEERSTVEFADHDVRFAWKGNPEKRPRQRVQDNRVRVGASYLTRKIRKGAKECKRKKSPKE